MEIKEAKEQLISLKEHCRMMQDTIFQKDVEAIETILKEYEKLEENQIWSEATIEGLKKDFIQKNKIKAKIEELENINIKGIDYSRIKYAIVVLQLLLE